MTEEPPERCMECDAPSCSHSIEVCNYVNKLRSELAEAREELAKILRENALVRYPQSYIARSESKEGKG